MKLKEAGTLRLQYYIEEVLTLKEAIATSELIEHETVAGKALAQLQCDAAIDVVRNLLQDIPEVPSAPAASLSFTFFSALSSLADNIGNTLELAKNLLPKVAYGGVYPQSYDILNARSGSWSVAISNRHNAALAQLTKALAKDLKQHLDDYFMFSRKSDGTVQLGVSPLSIVFSPDQILESAVLQMEVGLELWNSYRLLSNPSIHNQIYLMANILNPRFLEELTLKYKDTSDLSLFDIILPLSVAEKPVEDEGRNVISDCILDMKQAIEKNNSEKKMEAESRLKNILFEALRKERSNQSTVLPKLDSLYQAMCDVYLNDNPEIRKEIEKKFGQLLSNFNAYYIQFDSGTHSDTQPIRLCVLLDRLHVTNPDKCEKMITPFFKGAVSNAIVLLLSNNVNVKEGFVQEREGGFLMK